MPVVMHLQQRQGPIHGRCADIAEQREDIVLIHQLQRVANCEVGLVAVVIGLDRDPSAVERPRALAEKSADMPRRITLSLAPGRSASGAAVLSCADAGLPRSPRSTAASK